MLSRIMSSADLTTFAEVGLIIFVGTFVAIIVHTWRRSQAEIDECAQLPLEDEEEA